MVSVWAVISWLRMQDGADAQVHPPRHAALARRQVNYWTVIAPFMFIAACGVQTKLYVPAGTFAKETT